MPFYFHYIPQEEFEPGRPTLAQLTDFVQGEIGSEGNFGPYENLKVTSARAVKISGEVFWRCRTEGPAADLAIIRTNLKAEYGKLSPKKLSYNVPKQYTRVGD